MADKLLNFYSRQVSSDNVGTNTNQYLSIPDSNDWAFGSGNFTIECWFNPSIVSGSPILICQDDGSANRNFLLSLNTSQLNFAYVTSGGSFGDHCPTILSINTWYHAAAVRNGSTVTLYLNGVGTVIGTGVGTGFNINLPLLIGQRSGVGFFTGYIDEVRITKGLARYTSNFTPSTSPFSDDGSNVLLLHLEGNVLDDIYDPITGLPERTAKIVTNNGGNFSNNSKVGTESIYFSGNIPGFKDQPINFYQRTVAGNDVPVNFYSRSV